MSKANILGVTLAGLLMSVAFTAGAVSSGTAQNNAPVVSSTQAKADSASQDSTQAAKPAKHKKHKKKKSANQT